MNTPNELILNQRRDFGDVIGDSVKFMKINFKPLLSVFLTYLVPILLIPMIVLLATGYLTQFLESMSLDGPTIDPASSMGYMMGLMLMMFGFMLVYFLAYMVLNLSIYGAFLAYEENGNMVVTKAQIKAKIKSNFGNYLISILIYIPIIIVFYLMTMVLFMLGFALGTIATGIILLILPVVCAWFFTIIHNFSWIRIRENVGVGTGFERSFALIKNNWWSMFGVLFVSYLVVMILSYSFSIPFHLMTYFGSLSMVETDSGIGAGLMIVLSGLGFFIYLLGSLFLQQYVSACSIMKYYDMVEQRDGSSVAAQIDQLGETTESFFENEGEY